MSGALAAGHLHAGLLASAMGGGERPDALALFGLAPATKAKPDVEGLRARYPHWFTDPATPAPTAQA